MWGVLGIRPYLCEVLYHTKGFMLIDTINRHQVFIKQKIKSIDLLSLRKKCIFEA